MLNGAFLYTLYYPFENPLTILSTAKLCLLLIILTLSGISSIKNLKIYFIVMKIIKRPININVL